MSAFLCTPKHIGAVARVAVPKSTRANVAKILAKENIRSVGYRYPHTKDKETDEFLGMDLEWYMEECVRHATEDKDKEMDPGDVVQLLRSYMYQSCEHPEWEKSKARHLCYLLKSRLKAEPNPNAPWEI